MGAGYCSPGIFVVKKIFVSQAWHSSTTTERRLACPRLPDVHPLRAILLALATNTLTSVRFLDWDYEFATAWKR